MALYYFYCPDSISPNVVGAFGRRGYSCTPLTDDDADFWREFDNLENKSNLVLASHGSETAGPNLHKGDGGAASITEDNAETFANALTDRNIDFYCLSCLTGRDEEPFFNMMSLHHAPMVAPFDYASVSLQGSLQIKSIMVCEDCKDEFHGPPPNNVCAFGRPTSQCCGDSRWLYSGKDIGRRSGATLTLKNPA